MYEDVKAQLHGRPRKKIANNTYLELITVTDEEYINMYLHGYNIATFTKNYIVLSSCGWHTRTTKNRLNMALELAGLPYTIRIYQEKYTWYIGEFDYKFYDGMKVDYDGRVVS